MISLSKSSELTDPVTNLNQTSLPELSSPIRKILDQTSKIYSGLQTNNHSIDKKHGELSDADEHIHLHDSRGNLRYDVIQDLENHLHQSSNNANAYLANLDSLNAVLDGKINNTEKMNKSSPSGAFFDVNSKLLWVEKQILGELKQDIKFLNSCFLLKQWYCFVCNTTVINEKPGVHFCYSRVSKGVVCNYCGKFTSRMPDLRVHFRKIVYCKLTRKHLESQYWKYLSYLINKINSMGKQSGCTIDLAIPENVESTILNENALGMKKINKKVAND